MYFPTSLKLVGAVLLSSLVANAAYATYLTYLSLILTFADRPAELLRIMTLTKLVDADGNTVWSNPDGVNLKEVTDSEDNSQFNPSPSVYAMYKAMDGGWMDDNRTLVNPAFGLTTSNGEKMNEDDESDLEEVFARIHF